MILNDGDDDDGDDDDDDDDDDSGGILYDICYLLAAPWKVCWVETILQGCTKCLQNMDWLGTLGK